MQMLISIKKKSKILLKNGNVLNNDVNNLICSYI